MKRLPLITALTFASTFMVACSGGDNDDGREDIAPIDRTYVQFNPAASQLPIPNDILFSSETARDGTMSAGDANGNPVIAGIDDLDGSSLISPIDITIDGSIAADQILDAASFVAQGASVIPNPSQNVFLLPLTYPSGDGLLQASVDTNGDGVAESVEVPTFADALTFQSSAGLLAAAQAGTALPPQAVAAAQQALVDLAVPAARAELLSLDGGMNNTLRITPLKRLLPKTKYLVVVTGLNDDMGNPILPSRAYTTLRDPESNLSDINPSLPALRSAIQGWEQLANGYFSFMQTVYSAAGVSAEAPSIEDVIVSISFTTTAAEDILTSIAAPETFFEASFTGTSKKEAIVKLVTGVYNLSGDSAGLTGEDATVNSLINTLLTMPVLGGSPNPLFNQNIAGAIAQGADFATLAADPTAAFIMQSAAAEASIQGRAIPAAAQAQGTVAALSAAVTFPTPASRESTFYRVDNTAVLLSGGNVAAAATLPSANLYQGEITLPYYLSVPVAPFAVADATANGAKPWLADTTIGGAISEQTPPSSKITYRYPFPVKTADVIVPITVTMPNEPVLASLGIPRPENGWPVVIFNHGITTDRSASIPMGVAMASACAASMVPCYATVAIDQPMHGAVPAGSTVPILRSVNDPRAPITPNVPADAPATPSAMLTERHFNFSFDGAANGIPMNYSSDAAGGLPANFGDSGSLFINLTNFANTRDHLRQAVVDLLNVNASLAAMDVDGNGMADDLDTENVYFIGHSLGGITGIPFVAVNNSAAVQNSAFSTLPKVKAGAYLLTGGGIPRLLANSQSFAPRIIGGLAAASDQLQQGKSGLEAYFTVYQGILDSVDPINFATLLSDANSDTGTLLTEAIGDGGLNPSDMVIPNAADTIYGANNGPLRNPEFGIDGFPAPFSGTEPLIAEFGAVKSATPTADGDPDVLVTRFTEGNHGTPVSTMPEDVFGELVSQVIGFFAREGVVTQSIVTDATIVEE